MIEHKLYRSTEITFLNCKSKISSPRLDLCSYFCAPVLPDSSSRDTDTLHLMTYLDLSTHTKTSSKKRMPKMQLHL